MFGLDTIKLALIAGLIMSALGAGYAVYHGIQAAAVHKIELQQAKLIAQAQHDQDQRSIEALQAKADQAAALAAQVYQLKDALHAVPVSRSCLSSPAGRAFSVWLRSRGVSGAASQAPANSVAVPGSTSGSR